MKESAREIAAQRVGKLLAKTPLLAATEQKIAGDVVDLVLEALEERVDVPVLDAGRSELALALPKTVGKRDQKQLARVVWNAMVHAARRS